MTTPSSSTAIQIETGGHEVLRIENDGRVFWRKNGEMVRAEVDKDLALAFAISVAACSKMDYSKLVEELQKPIAEKLREAKEILEQARYELDFAPEYEGHKKAFKLIDDYLSRK